jgi:hypothetical protein
MKCLLILQKIGGGSQTDYFNIIIYFLYKREYYLQIGKCRMYFNDRLSSM